MKTLHVYDRIAFRVTTNSDRDNGRGRTQILGFFEDEVDAESAAKGQGIYGGDADVDRVPVTVYVPISKMDDSEDWERAFISTGSIPYVKKTPTAELRKSALKKLTAQEIAALGLNDASRKT